MLAWNMAVLEAVGNKYGFSVDEPIKKIKPEVLEKIFAGFGDELFTVKLPATFKEETTEIPFPGITVQTEKRLFNETESDWLRKKLANL